MSACGLERACESRLARVHPGIHHPVPAPCSLSGRGAKPPCSGPWRGALLRIPPVPVFAQSRLSVPPGGVVHPPRPPGTVWAAGPSQPGVWGPGGGPLAPRPTRPEGDPPASLPPGSMADSPREGKLSRSPDFVQLIDMASESVGGKVSGGLVAGTSRSEATRGAQASTAETQQGQQGPAEGPAGRLEPLATKASTEFFFRRRRRFCLKRTRWARGKNSPCRGFPHGRERWSSDFGRGGARRACVHRRPGAVVPAGGKGTEASPRARH